ncbi:unnamed protein product, partial [Discosporangium mesarthrocarpum]
MESGRSGSERSRSVVRGRGPGVPVGNNRGGKASGRGGRFGRKGGGRGSVEESGKHENKKISWGGDAGSSGAAEGKRNYAGGPSRGRGRGSQSPGRGKGRGGERGMSGARNEGGGRGGAANGKGDDGLPANKKRRLKLERQQCRPEFDTVRRSKEIWNKLRERKVPPEERTKLVRELLGLIKGKVLAIAMKHDSSRVVQTAIQFGNTEDRAAILSEVEGSLAELSQLTYAHFIVLKLLKLLRTPAEQRRLVKALRSEVVRLASHSIGARVVQTALDTLPAPMAASIK